MSARKWPAVYLILMAMVALTSSLWARFGASETCEMDGQAIPAGLRVDLKMADGTRHAFCDIECARRWLALQPHAAPKEAVVRDALTGEPLDAYVAFFVQSKVATHRAGGNNIHAFRFHADALEHIRRFGGQEMADPFGVP